MRSNFRYEIDNKSLTRKHRRCSIELICGSAPYASNTPVSRPSLLVRLSTLCAFTRTIVVFTLLSRKTTNQKKGSRVVGKRRWVKEGG